MPEVEWLALWGTDDPAADMSGLPLGPFGRIECADEDEARAIATRFGGRVFYRTATRSHWQPDEGSGGAS